MHSGSRMGGEALIHSYPHAPYAVNPFPRPPHGKPGLVEFVWIDDAPPCVDHKPDPRGAFTQRRSVALGKKILPMTVSKA